jgi:hypothetical protein
MSFEKDAAARTLSALPCPLNHLQAMSAVARSSSSVTKWRHPRRNCSLLAVGLALGLASTRIEPHVALKSIAGFRHFVAPTSRLVHPSLRAVTRLFSVSSASSSIFDTSSFSSFNLANLTPPQPPPVWGHTPEDVIKLTKEAIDKDREVQDRVARLPASECNFDTVSPSPPFLTRLFIVA